MQRIQVCFTAICSMWRRKEREEVNHAVADREQATILLGRMTPGGEKLKHREHAMSPDGVWPDFVERKLIFLDIDGPLAPWRNRRQHRWSCGDSFENLAYCKNVDSLIRIINSAGGPEVVKVIITSNWRTDPDKYQWLMEQMERRGIDVVGHTDLMQAYPRPKAHSHFDRTLEIRRVLEQRIVGTRGPYVTDKGKFAFEVVSFPETWKITAWIAIDDLNLATSRYHGLQNIQYLGRYMPVLSDPDVGRGWMSTPHNFVAETQTWLKAFASSHFVHVGSTAGIAGTKRAEERAKKLLQGV